MPVSIDDFIDKDDWKNLPKELVATFLPKNVIAKGYPFWTLTGDTTSFLMLFFDILATQMGGIGAMVFGIGFTHEFIFSHMMGGAGISLLFGNVYYGLQASKVAMQTGNMQTCAQPYGINTPGMFVKAFSIMAPILYSALAAEGYGPFVTGVWGVTSDAPPEVLLKCQKIAWNCCCCVNFLGGLVEFIGAFLAPMIVKNVPEPAFLVPLAGIGATWLGYAPLAGILASHMAHNPIVGFVPLLITWLGFFSSPPGKFSFGRIPPVGISAIVGVILFVIVNAQGYADGIAYGATFVGKGGVTLPDFSYFSSPYFQTMGGVSIVVGLAFTNFIGTFGCNISARLGGDIYSPAESMIIDGLGTMLGACFGSPLATTVYIGHPTYSKFGATRGYSIMTGVVYFIVGMAGLHGLLDALLPHEILLGSLVCVGFVIVQQTYAEAPARWYPALSIGIAICWSDYIVNLMGLTPNKDVKVFASGYVFVSVLWTFFFILLTDRWFRGAAAVFLFGAFTTLIGFTHAGMISLDYDENGMHVGGVPGTTDTWKYILMYSLGAVMCMCFWGLQAMGKFLAPEESDYRAIQKERYSTEAKKIEATATATA